MKAAPTPPALQYGAEMDIRPFTACAGVFRCGIMLS